MLARDHSWTDFQSLSPSLTLPESTEEPEEESLLTEVRRYERGVWGCLYYMLNRCGPHVQRINLRGFPVSYQLCALLSLTPNVTRFTIGNTDLVPLVLRDLQEGQLEEIGAALPRLETLRICGIQASPLWIRPFPIISQPEHLFQISSIIHFDRFSARASQLVSLCLKNVRIADGAMLDVTGVTFPQLKSLELDMSFDPLPLVERVAESSPLLVNFEFSVSVCGGRLYSDDENEALSRGLQTAVQRMPELRLLALRTSFMVSERTLSSRGGGNSLVGRLCVLELQVSTREMLHHLMTHCGNLRHLTLVMPSQDNDQWREPFDGDCDLSQLISFELNGCGTGIIAPCSCYQSIKGTGFSHHAWTASCRSPVCQQIKG